MRFLRSIPALVLVGTLLVQLAWILAVPPFRGFDEVDQSYRVAGVAGGDWLAKGLPEDGRGGLVSVPPDLVTAAHLQCIQVVYQRRDNCRAASLLPDGRARVASSASRYAPAYYWVVGSVARPFHGADALYAMRVAAAVLCSLGMALAAWCLGRRSTSRWPLVGMLLSFTPVFAYSTVVPAPNGLEMVSGLVLWTSLLSLGAETRRGDRWAIGAAVAAAALLVTLRSLGPVFALLILVCVVLVRRRELPAIWRAHARPLAAGVLVTGVFTAASVWWILVQGPLGTSDGDYSGLSYLSVLQVIPVGLLTLVAAGPSRVNSAPPIVYVVYVPLLVAWFVVAVRRLRGHARLALVVALLVSQVLPVVLTAAGLHSVGLIWQGRYGLPFAAGVVVLAGVLLDERGEPPPGPRPMLGLGVLWGVAQVTACAAVFHREHTGGASSGDPGWWQTSTLLVAVVAALGCLVLAALPLLVGSPDPERDPVAA